MFKKKKPTQTDIALLFRQLATLLSAGITMDRCLTILIQTQQNISIRQQLYLIKQAMLTGISLSDCIVRHPMIFNRFTQQLIILGEQTGTLDDILHMLANHHETQLQLKQKIVQALFYPIVLLIVALLIMLSLLIFIIPQFAQLYAQSNQPLPVMTRFIFTLSIFLNSYLCWSLICILAVATYLLVSHRKTSIIAIIHTGLRLLPPFHHLAISITITRVIKQLSIALSAGMPMLTALNLARLHHAELSAVIANLSSSIQAGRPLHQAMQAQCIFPSLLIQMTQVGEETGKLDDMLNKASAILESDIQQQISLLTQTLEPLIMIVLGVLIGGLVIAMYLPIFNLGTAF